MLEHPGLTLLFDEFVVKRDYRKSEEILEHILEERLAKEYEELVPRKYSWRLLGNSGLEQPSVRGGHAMCAYASTLWLFGGSECAQPFKVPFSNNEACKTDEPSLTTFGEVR